MYEFQSLTVNIIRDRLTRHHYPQDVQTFLQIKNQIWNWDFTSIGEYLQPQPLWTATPPLDHWPALPHQNYSDRAAATATVRRAATLNTLNDLTRNPPITYNHLLVLSNKVLTDKDSATPNERRTNTLSTMEYHFQSELSSEVLLWQKTTAPTLGHATILNTIGDFTRKKFITTTIYNHRREVCRVTLLDIPHPLLNCHII